MKYYSWFAAILICGMAAGTSRAQEWCIITAENATSNNLPRVLLIGDSIAGRYSAQVARALRNKAYVSLLATSRAVGSSALLNEIELALSQHKYALIHFNNGLHSGQGYDIYRRGFTDFLATIKQNSRGATLVWASSTAMAGWGEQVPKLNAIAAEFVARENIPVDDLYGLMAADADFNWWDGGGIHASAEGQARHAKQVADTILSLLPERPEGGWADDPYPFARKDVYEWCNISVADAGRTDLPRVLTVGDSSGSGIGGALAGKARLSTLSTSKSAGDPALLEEIKLVLKQTPYAVVHFNSGLHWGAGYTPDEYRSGLPALFSTVSEYAPDAIVVWATTPHTRGEGIIKRECEFDGIARECLAGEDGPIRDFYEFYGPNAKDARARSEGIPAVGLRSVEARQRILAARESAGDSIQGRNMQLALEYVQSLKARNERTATRPKNDSRAEAVERAGAELKLDGRLDEPFWDGVPMHELKDAATGGPSAFKSTSRIAWSDQALVIGIRCEDEDMQGLNIPTRENEDDMIWVGDNIELVIETQAHSYYQISIGPSGAVVDCDRKRGAVNKVWSSGIEVAAHAGNGFWSLEFRVPAAGDDAEARDPSRGMAGHKPTKGDPWYFNLYRQRVRGNANEGSLLFPAGSLHEPSEFGELIVQ